MLEQRNLKVDLLALGLLALTVFLAAALLSYDPADPPSKLVFPERVETLNVCGRFGALVSRLLLLALGVGAYYVLVSLAAADAVLLSRRNLDQPSLRAAGWLLSLLGVCTLAAMAGPIPSPGPVIGSGGYLGAAARGLLEMHFARVGAYILTTSLILGGLLLCSDYVVVRILAWVVGRPVRGLGRGVTLAAVGYSQRLGRSRTTRKAGDRRADGEGEPGSGHPIRIVNRSADSPRSDQADGDADQTDESDGHAAAAEQPSPARTVQKTFASLLRGRKSNNDGHIEVVEQLDATEKGDEAGDYELPTADMLLAGESVRFEEHEKEIRRKAKILEKTFADFGFNIRVVEIQTGPVIAQFEVELEAGLRLSRITGLADDLAIALRVPSVRIVAPLPGKNTVGIEVPNNERQLVRLREVMEQSSGRSQKMRVPIYLGKDVAGHPMVVDLATLPHLLIAGRTGTGKSVCLNSIIISILMTRRPDEVRLLLVDPKMVELSPYKCLPHLMHPVVTDMRKAEAILAWAVEKMEERYQLLARAGVRHISVYNQLGREELLERIQPADEEEEKRIPNHIPYIVIVADEMADLMMTAAKEVEGHIIRLAQKSRAVGIHLVLATQKPTVDVITGLIKSNLPARICFQVASRTDSRVVLDEMGADKLLGNGDMLFLWPGTSTIIRGQGTYVSDDEINRVIASVATSEPEYLKELVQLKTAEPQPDGPQLGNRDELYEAAVDVVVREGRGSVSLLQRALGIGYGRAARLIDYMAEDGIVGPYNGSQAREVTISVEDWESRGGQSPGERIQGLKSAAEGRVRLDASREPRAPLAGVALSGPFGRLAGDEDDGDDEDDTEIDFREDRDEPNRDDDEPQKDKEAPLDEDEEEYEEEDEEDNQDDEEEEADGEEDEGAEDKSDESGEDDMDEVDDDADEDGPVIEDLDDEKGNNGSDRPPAGGRAKTRRPVGSL